MKFAVLVLVLLLPAAGALADVNAGRTIAETWCKNCHNVSPGDTRMHDTGAPAFTVVANSKAMTTTALTVFLFNSHNRMPDYSLTRQEVADVSAYIMSLKSPERPATGR